MSKSAYSPLKAAWHLERIQALREGGQIVPVGLQLILSDFCNHDCHFCAYRASNGLSKELFRGPDKQGNDSHNPLRMMDATKAEEIIQDAAAMGVESITFTGGGEPTVHPHHLELFQEALDAGLACSLNTNGNILRAGWDEVLPRMAYVRFSIDAGTREEYAKIRGVNETVYEKVLENLTQVVMACTKTVVGTGYVVTPENWINLPQGVDNIKATGASYVRLASMQSTEQENAYEPYQHKQAARMCEDVAREYTDENFSVVNLFEGTLGVRPSQSFCGFQQFVSYIGADLNVYRCCYTAYTSLGKIGNLEKQSFKEWFETEQKQRLIDEFDARDCSICPLESKNRTINYMIEDRPVHVEFV